jgi:hypothetical protein
MRDPVHIPPSFEPQRRVGRDQALQRDLVLLPQAAGKQTQRLRRRLDPYNWSAALPSFQTLAEYHRRWRTDNQPELS